MMENSEKILETDDRETLADGLIPPGTQKSDGEAS